MVKINSHFNLLFNSIEASNVHNQKEVTTRKVKKRIPVKTIKESTQKDKKQLDKENQEGVGKEEVKRIEKVASCNNEDEVLHRTKSENLPLREAIIFSEMIGKPKCKSRCRRRGTR